MTMTKTLLVSALSTLATLAIPDKVAGQALISGEDAYFSETLTDQATGTTTLLTITGARSTLRQVGQPTATSIGCQVELTRYDSAGNILLQGVGSSDPDSTTLAIAQNLSKATLDASMMFVDFNTGEMLALDLSLSFSSRGPQKLTVTDNGDPSGLLIKDSRAAVVSGSVQLDTMDLKLGGQPAMLERSQSMTH